MKKIGDDMYKRGFTLAEVLITLGIIGVVAALTIPSFLSNYQKRVLTTQLQKAYSEISQAGAMVVAYENTDDFRYSKAIKNGNFIGKYLKAAVVSNDYLPAVYKLDGKDYNFRGEIRNNFRCGKLGSGAVICVGPEGAGILDVNGPKGPNTVGKDAFTIGFMKNGTISYHYSAYLESIVRNDWDIDNIKNW